MSRVIEPADEVRRLFLGSEEPIEADPRLIVLILPYLNDDQYGIALAVTLLVEDQAVRLDILQAIGGWLAAADVDAATGQFAEMTTADRSALRAGARGASVPKPNLDERTLNAVELLELVPDEVRGPLLDEFLHRVQERLEARADASIEIVGGGGVGEPIPTEISADWYADVGGDEDEGAEEEGHHSDWKRAKPPKFPLEPETELEVEPEELDLMAPPPEVGPTANGGDAGRAEHGSRRTAERPPRKGVWTGFADPLDPVVPLDVHMPLRSGSRYQFWLEIGDEVAGAIEIGGAHPVPDDVPNRARLTVVLFSFRDELGLREDQTIGELELLPDRSALVVARPDGTEPDVGQRRLSFSVTTPSREGTFRLRCNLYYQQLLIQSRLVTARTMHDPRPFARRRALRADVDYALAKRMHPAELERLAPHRLSIMLNDDGHGTHAFRVYGSDGKMRHASEPEFEGHELENAITDIRGAFRKASWGTEDLWDGKAAYRYDGRVTRERLREDLLRLAWRGSKFYDSFVGRIAQRADGRQPADPVATFEALIRKPSLIQVALKKYANYVLPVAGIYDRPLETDPDKEAYRLCAALEAGLTGPGDLQDLPCFEGACPDADDAYAVCPAGFWGYRHYLGLPVTVAGAPSAPPDIPSAAPTSMVAGFSTDRLTMWGDHRRDLEDLGLGMDAKDTRAEVLALLRDSKSPLVYFYCHGGMDHEDPYLQVGGSAERVIVRRDLRLERVTWSRPRPLVFINGCHTAAVEPETAINLVGGFVETSRAAGVIGTEITIFEPLATKFAVEYFRRFLAGDAVGAAIRGARLALLKQLNPLGLVYIPFAVASLRLTGSPTRKPQRSEATPRVRSRAGR